MSDRSWTHRAISALELGVSADVGTVLQAREAAALLEEINALRAELEAEQKAHNLIASVCFAAGAETGDGTSVDAVRRLAAELEAVKAELQQARELIEKLSDGRPH